MDNFSVDSVIQNSNAEIFRGSTFSVKDVVSKFTNCVMIQITRTSWDGS